MEYVLTEFSNLRLPLLRSASLICNNSGEAPPTLSRRSWADEEVSAKSREVSNLSRGRRVVVLLENIWIMGRKRSSGFHRIFIVDFDFRLGKC